jgi:hypothetical protein
MQCLFHVHLYVPTWSSLVREQFFDVAIFSTISRGRFIEAKQMSRFLPNSGKLWSARWINKHFIESLIKQKKQKQSPLFLVKFDQKNYPSQRLSTIWRKSKQMSYLDICFASMNRPQLLLRSLFVCVVFGLVGPRGQWVKWAVTCPVVCADSHPFGSSAARSSKAERQKLTPYKCLRRQSVSKHHIKHIHTYEIV